MTWLRIVLVMVFALNVCINVAELWTYGNDPRPPAHAHHAFARGLAALLALFWILALGLRWL